MTSCVAGKADAEAVKVMGEPLSPLEEARILLMPGVLPKLRNVEADFLVEQGQNSRQISEVATAMAAPDSA